MVCSNFLTVSWIVSKLAQILIWDSTNKLVDFGDIDLIFKVTRVKYDCEKRLVCTLSCYYPITRVWPNWHIHTIGKTLTNDCDSVALTLIPRSPESHNSIKWMWGGAPSKVIHFSFLTPLVWQYIKQCLPRCLPCNTKIPIIDLIIPYALRIDIITLHTF